jgi:hypothetical protein
VPGCLRYSHSSAAGCGTSLPLPHHLLIGQPELDFDQTDTMNVEYMAIGGDPCNHIPPTMSAVNLSSKAGVWGALSCG